LAAKETIGLPEYGLFDLLGARLGDRISFRRGHLKGTGMRLKGAGDSVWNLRALFLSQPRQWETFGHGTAA
jgi:hypothetical protein